jgi:glyoxylase-like metal-dependent hydrolase (beta-lactamase superfamily II)
MDGVVTIDSGYTGHERFAAAFLLREGDEAAFVETATANAVPRLLDALREQGLEPDQVRYVIITHVHLDHAGGASALMKVCPNATLLAHPRAAKHAIDPSKLVASAKAVYGEDAFTRMYGTIEPIDAARVEALDDEATITWGSRTLKFLHTRGHANHHFCVVDDGTSSIFTGDSFGLVYPDLQDDGLWALPSTSPTDFDAAAAKESVDRIVGSGAKTAYLTHFGGHSELEAIAAQLHAQLDAYGKIVDDAMDSGVDGDELDAMCRARVEAIFEPYLTTERRRRAVQPDGMLAMDVDLNAQGIAFAVKKRRHKQARG